MRVIRYCFYPERLKGLTVFKLPELPLQIEYVDRDRNHPEVTVTGRRSDAQDYDLVKWIEQGKLYWLDPQNEERLVRQPVSAFPYCHVNGRRHPYYIENGQVYDLPDPVQGEPEIEMETFL